MHQTTSSVALALLDCCGLQMANVSAAPPPGGVEQVAFEVTTP